MGKNKSVMLAIGVMLTLIGLFGTLFIASNREYAYVLIATGFSVVAGVILVAVAFSD
ncbi:MAG: hypothetical protein KJ592_04655 [Nanoarchaeota archaeon]|nr:hypothetical protein [Nanoarchaeota archaeon]